MIVNRLSRALIVLCGAVVFAAAARAQSPSVSIISPTSPAYAPGAVTFNIQASTPAGTIFPSATGNTVTITSSAGIINGGTRGAGFSIPFSGIGDSSMLVSTVLTLTNGQYTIKATVTNNLGLTKTASVTFNVNSGGIGGTSGAVAYAVTFNPETEIATGNIPFTLQTQGSNFGNGYLLQVNGPQDYNGGDYPMSVTYQIGLLSKPTQASLATALSYVTMDSYTPGAGGAPGTDNNDGIAPVGSVGAMVTVTFTGANQSRVLHIQEQTDSNAYAGNYLYQVSGVWSYNGTVISNGSLGGLTPSNGYMVEYGAGNTVGEPTINTTLTLPAPATPPTVAIKVPADGTTVSIYPDSLDYVHYPPYAVVEPIIVEGDFSSSTAPVSNINVNLSDAVTDPNLINTDPGAINFLAVGLQNTTYLQDHSYAGSYSYDVNGALQIQTVSVVGDAVAATSSDLIIDPGIYYISATATSAGAGGTSNVARESFNVVETDSPGVAITFPANGSVFGIPYPGTTTVPAFSISGNASPVIDYVHGNTYVNIGQVTYSLTDQNGNAVPGFNGTALAGSGDPVFSSWLSNNSLIPTPTAAGSLPALGPGTYTLTVTVSNVAGAQTATSTFTVAEVPAPTVAPTVNPPGGSPVTSNGTGGGSSGSANVSVTILAGQSSVTVSYTASGGLLGPGTLDAALTSAGVTGNNPGFAAPVISGLPATGFSTSGAGITFTSAGTYTLTAADTNSSGSSDPYGLSASASVTLVVSQVATPSIALTASPTDGTPAATATGFGGGAVGSAIINLVIPSTGHSVTVPYSVSGGVSAGGIDGLLTSASVSSSLNGFVGIPALLVLPVASVSGNSSITFNSPGLYTLTAMDSNASLLNLFGVSASATITFNVVQAAVPTVRLTATPAGGSPVMANGTGGGSSGTNSLTVYIPAGQSSVTVPYTASGGISGGGSDNTLTSAGVTSNFPGFTPLTIPGLPNPSFSTTGTSITFNASGSYSLIASDSNSQGASDPNGYSTSATLNFTVQKVATPTVTLSVGGASGVSAMGTGGGTPGSNAITVTIPAGQGSLTVPYSAIGAISTGTVDTSLTSASVTSNFPGFNTINVAGLPQSGFSVTGNSITFSGFGTYTLTAMDSNSGGSNDANAVTASATITITVKQVATPSVAIAYPPTGTGSQSSSITGTGGNSPATATLAVTIPAGKTSITVPYTASGSLGAGNIDHSLTMASVAASPAPSGFTAPTIGVPVPSFSTGSTSITFNSGGSFVLTATDSNSTGSGDANGVSAAAALTINVTQVATPTVTLSVGSSPTAMGTGGNPGTPGSSSVTITIPAGQSSISVPYAAGGSISAGNADGTLTSASVTSNVSGFSPPAISLASGSGFSVTGNSIVFNAGGNFTVVAQDSNSAGSGDANGVTATATVNVTVVQVPTPTVSLTATPPGGSPVTVTGTTGSTPTVNIVIPAGQTSVSVPYVATGGISGGGSTDNTLTAASVSSGAPGFAAPSIHIPTTSFTTSATNITFSAAGNYTLTASDSNLSSLSDPNGATVTASITFNVVQVATPTVTLGVSPAGSTPVTVTGTGGGTAGSGSVLVQIPSGQSTVSVPYTASGALSNSGSIDNSLTSASVTSSAPGFTPPVISGLPGANFSVTGNSLTFAAPGTYILAATDSNVAGGSDTNGVSASATITITVTAGNSGCSGPSSNAGYQFNGTAINAGSTLWFSSVVQITSGLSNAKGSLYFNNSAVTLVINGTTTTLPAPAATITFSNSATQVATTYNAVANAWQTTVPVGFSGFVFLTGFPYLVPSTIAGNLGAGGPPPPPPPPGSSAASSSAISWTGSFSSDTAAVATDWQMAAAVYTQFGTDLNSLGVKPSDSSTLDQYKNADETGTPETYKAYCIGGAGGNGAKDGNYNNDGAGDVNNDHSIGDDGGSGYTGAFGFPTSPTVTYCPPPITVAIGAPIDGSTVLIPPGSSSVSPNFTISGASNQGTVTAASVSLNGTPVSPAATITGLGTTSITGNGPLSLTAGTYTLSATDSNGLNSATATAGFTVVPGTACSGPVWANPYQFNNTAIVAGSTLWFSGVVQITSGLTSGTINFNNSTITFYSGGQQTTLLAPAATITFSSTATAASTVYNAGANAWQTTVPAGFTGYVFLTGMPYYVSTTIPGGLNSIAWHGAFTSGTPAVAIDWQMAAAVYTQFASNLNAIGVKPTDSATLDQYKNSDETGTPENEKAYCIGGAGGNGAQDGNYNNDGAGDVNNDHSQGDDGGGGYVGQFSSPTSPVVQYCPPYGVFIAPGAGGSLPTTLPTPPTLTISPSDETVITIPYGAGNGPVQITVTGSVPSGRTIVSATVNFSGGGNPPITGLGTNSISWSQNVNLNPGSYQIAVVASDGVVEGYAFSDITVVNAPPPPPTITIQQPNVTSVAIQQGGATAQVQFQLQAQTSGPGSPNNGITAFAVTLNGSPISLPVGGLNSPNAQVNGNLNLGPGTYLLVATATNAGGTTTTQETITVAAPPTTVTNSVSANFNGQAIPMGDYIWFNAVLQVHGLQNGQGAEILFSNSSITFTVPPAAPGPPAPPAPPAPPGPPAPPAPPAPPTPGTTVTINVPGAMVTFDPTVTTATTTFNSVQNIWITTVPSNYNGNVFLTGVAYYVPSALPGNIQNVTWTGTFTANAPNLQAQWQWGAAAYTSFSTNLGALGVKPVDDNKTSQYTNGDHAGSPENFTASVTNGAGGGGGNNYTGSGPNSPNFILPDYLIHN